MPTKGPLPSAHEPSAKKLRTFFSSKKDVTAEQFKKVTCFGDLHEHTGITAEDAKAAMVADHEAAKDDEMGVDDEEKSVKTERCWTKVATKTTERGGEPSIETLTKYESKLMYFEVLKDLPETIVAEMDEVFMKIEEAYKDAAAEPPKKRRKVEKPSEAEKMKGKKKAKKDKEEKKENKEEMKAKLAELLETAKALQERMEALQ